MSFSFLGNHDLPRRTPRSKMRIFGQSSSPTSDLGLTASAPAGKKSLVDSMIQESLLAIEELERKEKLDGYRPMTVEKFFGEIFESEETSSEPEIIQQHQVVDLLSFSRDYDEERKVNWLRADNNFHQDILEVNKHLSDFEIAIKEQEVKRELSPPISVDFVFGMKQIGDNDMIRFEIQKIGTKLELDFKSNLTQTEFSISQYQEIFYYIKSFKEEKLNSGEKLSLTRLKLVIQRITTFLEDIYNRKELYQSQYQALLAIVLKLSVWINQIHQNSFKFLSHRSESSFFRKYLHGFHPTVESQYSTYLLVKDKQTADMIVARHPTIFGFIDDNHIKKLQDIERFHFLINNSTHEGKYGNTELNYRPGKFKLHPCDSGYYNSFNKIYFVFEDTEYQQVYDNKKIINIRHRFKMHKFKEIYQFSDSEQLDSKKLISLLNKIDSSMTIYI